jgi:DNA-binding Xre family transcriptional regulator
MKNTQEAVMRFSYNKLFKLLIDKGIKKKELCEMAEISATSIAKLGHGGNVNSEVLLKICNALNCDVGDIMEFVRDESEETIEEND